MSENRDKICQLFFRVKIIIPGRTNMVLIRDIHHISPYLLTDAVFSLRK